MHAECTKLSRFKMAAHPSTIAVLSAEPRDPPFGPTVCNHIVKQQPQHAGYPPVPKCKIFSARLGTSSGPGGSCHHWLWQFSEGRTLSLSEMARSIRHLSVQRSDSGKTALSTRYTEWLYDPVFVLSPEAGAEETFG